MDPYLETSWNVKLHSTELFELASLAEQGNTPLLFPKSLLWRPPPQYMNRMPQILQPAA